ncbi:PREDICTED: protein ERGIC-53-like [Elephantulus edwardii]|uniref:protein ERGIC-53-like n=1 Tax=Elephantulus edwardii TaxID=28737 RepID=UPI0003F09644|nr:PREDICTED: protein ERGIC-53-like [Elephantulus edwardii]
MPGPRGPLLCLLLLLLVPHISEGGRPPHRRFEYKLSFKGPKLALPGAGIPFWSHHGDAIPGLEEVRLAPSMRNRSGAVWSKFSVPFSVWDVELQMRVTGPGRRGSLGMAVWYTQGRGQVGSVLDGTASWHGVAILFDSSAEDTQNSPVIRVLASDGHTPSEERGDRPSQVLGSCHRDFRNRPYPIKARITYWGQQLRVSLNSGLTPSDPDEVCVNVGPLLLAPGGFFGISAATSTLADDHDVLSFLTFSLTEPGPEASHEPFLEMEQLHLTRQLEELQAKLARSSKADATMKPDSEAQEGGEKHFDLQKTLGRHSRVLQALQGLSEQLAHAEGQWKRQVGSSGGARPEEGWLVDSNCQMPTKPSRGFNLVLALLQDSAKVSSLLHGQQTLLQDLQEMRAVASQMASDAQAFYLPVGTKHHFLELDQMLSLLQKDLRDQVKVSAKASRSLGQPPGTSSCLRSGIFLFFLLIQTMGFFSYVHFRQELDKSLQDCLSLDRLPLDHLPRVSRALGVLRRQPLSPSMQA